MEYIVNEQGERTRVVLTVEEYERLIEAAEDAEDIRDAREFHRRLDAGEEEVIPWEESKARRSGERV